MLRGRRTPEKWQAFRRSDPTPDHAKRPGQWRTQLVSPRLLGVGLCTALPIDCHGCRVHGCHESSCMRGKVPYLEYHLHIRYLKILYAALVRSHISRLWAPTAGCHVLRQKTPAGVVLVDNCTDDRLDSTACAFHHARQCTAVRSSHTKCTALVTCIRSDALQIALRTDVWDSHDGLAD